MGISVQRSSCIIFGLTDIVALIANEAWFFRFRVIFQACYLLNEVGDPPFFCISDISNSLTLSGKSLRKKSMLENFRANVLKTTYLKLILKQFHQHSDQLQTPFLLSIITSNFFLICFTLFEMHESYGVF